MTSDQKNLATETAPETPPQEAPNGNPWDPKKEDDEEDQILEEPSIAEFETCVKVLDFLTARYRQFELYGSKIVPTLPPERKAGYGRIFNHLVKMRESHQGDRRDKRRQKKKRVQARKAIARDEDDLLRDTAGMRQDRTEKRAISGFAKIPYAFNCKDQKPALLPATQEGQEEKREESPEVSEVQEGPVKKTFKMQQFCYVCKERYMDIHHYYDTMCGVCGELNYDKRMQAPDLTGRTAILTGGRVKIGFFIGLKLLRGGATLIVTTRFPRDAIQRYSEEDDSEHWMSRLHVYGLDLRVLTQLDQFTHTIRERHPKLDFIINNAAQTVRRPTAFYKHLIETETTRLPPALEASHRQPIGVPPSSARAEDTAADSEHRENRLVPARSGAGSLIATQGAATSTQTAMSVVLDEDRPGYYSKALFPENLFDENAQQVDLRSENTWTDNLGAIQPMEALECMLVNQFSPFTLVNQLLPLMERPDGDQEKRFIVNVSAMEGVFNWNRKPTRHPHTNMAKAGLNMMTRTCARDLARRGIFLTSVDTGWVSDEFPVGHPRNRKHPPLDEIDGAARVLDPIFSPLVHEDEDPSWGVFLKDYKPINW